MVLTAVITCTLVRRVKVAGDEVRIMGSKSELLRTLVATSTVEAAAFGIHRSVLKWRAIPGDDENYIYSIPLHSPP